MPCRKRPAPTDHFLFALASFAARGALGNGVPSRAFLVCTGSAVLGAAAPLWVTTPDEASFGFALPAAGTAVEPTDLSFDEPFDEVPDLPVVPFAADDVLWGDVAALPPVPVVDESVPWACAGPAAQRIAAQAVSRMRPGVMGASVV